MNPDTELQTLHVGVAPMRSNANSGHQNHWKPRIIIGVVVFICLVVLLGTVTAIVVKDSQKDRSTGTRVINPIILISLDGFRYDYLARKLASNLTSLAQNGVVADFLRAQFPTKTFPNHYSIATGLYPESHGIVANTFLSEDRQELFRIGGKTVNEGKWWGGEPIWITAVKQGLKSASYFWVGSEAPVQGVRPTYWKQYKQSTPYEERVKTVLDWISTGPADSRPMIVTLYHHQPDSSGHSFGPDSIEVNKSIVDVDNMVGLLRIGLKERNLLDNVNIIVLTDHGMTAVDCSKVVYLDTLSKLENVSVIGQGSFGYIYGKTKEAAQKVYDELKCGHTKLRAYFKNGVYTPKRLHHMNSRRSGEISLVAENGWSFLSNSGSCPGTIKGAHGYDNLEKDMRGIFIAHGPDFKIGYHAGYFENTELYNLLCELLDLTPAPNNGTEGSLYHLLRDATKKQMPVPRPVGDGNAFQQCGSALVSQCSGTSGCVCPYCDYGILANLTLYDQHLILSAQQIVESHKKHLPYGLPAGGAGSPTAGCVLTQRNYVTGYSTNLRIPLWVAYEVTREQLKTNIPRKNCFRRDPRLLPKYSANCSDFDRNDYDRGHMAPNGDFNFERYAEQDTNVFSNIAPQHKNFNRKPGLWFMAESLTRDWAIEYGPILVISGSIFDGNNDGIRDQDDADKRWLQDHKDGVAIPTHFYKILVRCLQNKTSEYNIPGCSGSLDVLAFVLPHNEEPLCKFRKWQTNLFEYVATVRDIERLTGSVFFPDLPTTLQAELKTKLPLELWPSKQL